jgi:hypothetical protein
MRLIAFVSAIFILSSCLYRQAYYVSALNGLNNPYQTVPLQSDSIKTVFYASTTISSGTTNDKGSDKVFAVQSNIFLSHNFRYVQAHGGAGITLGSYTLSHYDNYGNNSTVNAAVLNQFASNYFFGGYGVSGGINVALPFSNGGEFRVGLETSLQNEFGDYLQTRRKIPDSAATYVIPNKFFSTVGIYSELVDKTDYGSFSIKISGGHAMGKAYHTDIRDQYVSANLLSYKYFSVTLAPAIKKWTPYFQANFATKSSNALFGLNYRLGK